MSSCKPYGDVSKAKVLVIGHDPRLQRSEAQAQYAFFLDYLEKPIPLSPAEKRKYGLASSVVSYIRYLTGSALLLQDIYFTNLCNEFLKHPYGGGTLLITEGLANRGVAKIERTLLQGTFKLILSMTPQVFYHLVRTGFVANIDESLIEFLSKARPSELAKQRKAYQPSGRSPFLTVCGGKYYYHNDQIPIIPIVHVKQWPLNSRMAPHYDPLMKMAVTNATECL